MECDCKKFLRYAESRNDEKEAVQFNDEETLKKIHEAETEILNYVTGICDQNGLQYVLLYGTALGAYRHQGFIPWDDDIDIGLPREDYDKLCRILDEDQESNFDFHDFLNDENYIMLFSKARKKNTVFIESITETEYKYNGIYIDIFPLEPVGSLSSEFKKAHKEINLLKHALKFTTHKNLYREKEGMVKYLADSVLSRSKMKKSVPETRKELASMIEKACKDSMKSGEVKYLGEFDETEDRALVPYDCYFPTAKLMFEGKEYSVPGKIESYLEQQYGKDYMELPPMEERRSHKPVKLEF